MLVEGLLIVTSINPWGKTLNVAIKAALMSWLIYALGGGWGHLMRALAFGRIAALYRPVTILSNSPYTANLLNSAAEEALLPVVAGCYIQVISPAASFTQTCDRVRQIVSRMT